MSKTIFEKILENHLVEGKAKRGEEIGIKIDQVLLQDTTGGVACLEFEAMGFSKPKCDLAVCYVDHNVLKINPRNANDHKFLETFCQKYGILFSKPGNGICHQVHLERFAKPRATILGSDSHTPTAGGLGALAIGAGSLDVAFALAGEPFYFKFPQLVKIKLEGKMKSFVSAKDVILEILRQIGVEGGKGKIFEFSGGGIKNLISQDRATICNMMVETGATSSIFPSDEITFKFLKAQKREKDFEEIFPDKDAFYDEELEIDLEKLEPLVAIPSSPGNVKKVKEIEGLKVDQVIVGSCTNSSLRDLKIVANLIKGKKVHPQCEFLVVPGSRQVILNLEKTGELKYLIEAGAQILESSCGPCIGMGHLPHTNAVSLRTFNRNFPGRSGTPGDKVYLASPETAVACAIFGKFVDPRDFFEDKKFKMILDSLPQELEIDDSQILKPSAKPEEIEIFRGPYIKPLPQFQPVFENNKVKGEVLLKLGDNISTDEILPAGTNVLPLRTDIEASSRYTFYPLDQDFFQRVKEKKGGIIVAGKNYGQGSSREHAAICPRYLGVKVVLAKSIARIHLANLINFGILPLIFKNETDFEKIEAGDFLEIETNSLKEKEIEVKNLTKSFVLKFLCELSEREREIVLKGGKFNWVKSKWQE